MSSPPPILCTWTGEAFVPLPRFQRDAAAYAVGAAYKLVPHEDRSGASHRHYFAIINEAWRNLPEDKADRWPTPEHLRKWALIRAGYRDERTHVCASRAEAHRTKAFIRPIDDYAVVLASEAVVTVYTAKSQSVRAMGKADFQASKDAVLTILAELLGIDPTTLADQAKEAA